MSITAQFKYLILAMLIGGLLSGCNAQQRRMGYTNYKPSPPPKMAEPVNTSGTIYTDSRKVSLFSDLKASQIGDVITIVLSEKTNASKSATTTTKKESKADTGTPTLFGGAVTKNGRSLLSSSLDASNEFSGEGDSSQSNALTGTISVTVAEVYNNGNLFVRGQKILYLNQGEEYIQISGIVRQADIGPTNSIPSSLLADARISYSGTGVISESNKMGWLTKFFNSSYWPL